MLKAQGAQRWSFVFGVFLLAGACSDVVSVEPLLGEDNETVRWILDQQGKSGEVSRAAAVVKQFLVSLEGQQCQDAWLLLSAAYQQQVVGVAGSEEQAVKEVCGGRVVQSGALVARPWSDVLMGPSPAYLTPSPKEIPLRMPSGRALFFVVQQDGSYRAFVLVNESSGTKIEPFF